MPMHFAPAVAHCARCEREVARRNGYWVQVEHNRGDILNRVFLCFDCTRNVQTQLGPK